MRVRLSQNAILVLMAAALAPMATAQPVAQSAPALSPVVDKLIGFEIGAPTGWSVDRTAFFGPAGSRGLLRGASPDGLNTFQVLVFSPSADVPFAAWAEYFARQLATISGIRDVRVEPLTHAGREAAFVEAPAVLGADHTRTLFFCLRLDAELIWVLSYAEVLGRSSEDATARAATALEVPPLVRRMIDSLRVFYDAGVAREFEEGLERGREYLRRFQLADDIRELRIDESPRSYVIRVGGKAVGYLTRRFARATEPLDRARAGAQPREGLRVYERTWQFAADGAAVYSRVELFSRLDGNTDLYEFNTTHVPAASMPDGKPFSLRDQCVREGDALFSSVTSTVVNELPTPREPVRVDDAYLGLSWVRVLPALLGVEPRALIAFHIYDPSTRTLVPHSVKVVGERTLPGSTEPAVVYETREGAVPSVTVVYTDRAGHMLRLECGELLVERAAEEEIERLFRAQRDAALKAAGIGG